MENLQAATTDHVQAKYGNKKLESKKDSLKADIKTHLVEQGIETVSIFERVFRTGSPEALINFIMVLHNIIKVKVFYTGPQKSGLLVMFYWERPSERLNRRLGNI